MSEEIANQSEQSQEVERDADTEALYESFGMPQQSQSKKDVEFPKMDEPNEPLTMEDEEEEVQGTETTPGQSEKKTIKIKYLGEDKDVPEDEAPTWIQKGMNHDRLQEKLSEQQKALDEVAQLQGFKDHAELIANLPKLREQQQMKEKAAYDQLRQDLRQQAEDAGLDPDQVQAYLDNNPIVKQAEQALQERETERLEQQRADIQRQVRQKWDALYEKYPHLVEESQAFNRGESPSFYNAEMQSRIDRGYDPVDAFELAHRDTISAQTKKSAEQRVIKQQQLGMRGHVNEQSATPPDEGSLLPVHYGLAEEFGVSLKGVQRQNQLLKSRR